MTPLLVPSPNDNIPHNQPRRSNPPQSRQLFTKHHPAGQGSQHEIGTRIDNRNAGRGRSSGQGAREKSPHESIEG